jgi:hypothetical protein
MRQRRSDETTSARAPSPRDGASPSLAAHRVPSPPARATPPARPSTLRGFKGSDRTRSDWVESSVLSQRRRIARGGGSWRFFSLSTDKHQKRPPLSLSPPLFFTFSQPHSPAAAVSKPPLVHRTSSSSNQTSAPPHQLTKRASVRSKNHTHNRPVVCSLFSSPLRRAAHRPPPRPLIPSARARAPRPSEAHRQRENTPRASERERERDAGAPGARQRGRVPSLRREARPRAPLRPAPDLQALPADPVSPQAHRTPVRALS